MPTDGSSGIISDTDGLVRAKRLVTGHAFKYVESLLFDKFIYGVVSAWASLHYGLVGGSFTTFAIMAPISAIECLVLLLIYDRMKTDWFGFEELKATGNLELPKPDRWYKLHGWIFYYALKVLIPVTEWRTPFVARAAKIGIMSVLADPLMTTIYLRRSGGYGLHGPDYTNFLMSVVVSNGWWSFRMSVIATAFIYVYQFFAG
jgi:hypothetical protein